MILASFPYVMNKLLEMFVKLKANFIDYVTVPPLVGVHHHALHHGVHLLANHTLEPVPEVLLRDIAKLGGLFPIAV